VPIVMISFAIISIQHLQLILKISHNIHPGRIISFIHAIGLANRLQSIVGILTAP